MSSCSWTDRVEAFHDGEAARAKGVDEHLQGCADCREYLSLLQQVSAGVVAVKKDVEIADAQFRVFMDGIRDGIEAQPSAWLGFWSKLSIYAAGFVLVVALSYIVTSGPVRTWAAQYFDSSVSVHDENSPDPGLHRGAQGSDENPKTKRDF